MWPRALRAARPSRLVRHRGFCAGQKAPQPLPQATLLQVTPAAPEEEKSQVTLSQVTPAPQEERPQESQVTPLQATPTERQEELPARSRVTPSQATPPTAQPGSSSREKRFLDWWPVPAGVLGLILTYYQYEAAKRANEEAFKNSDEYKIQEAVKKFMKEQPTVPEKEAQREVVTDLVERLRDRVKGWGTKAGASGDEKYLGEHATVLTGLFEAGKSTAVRQALAGVRGVFQVQLRVQEKCDDAVFDALGVTGEAMFMEVIRRVAKELRNVSQAKSGAVTRVPLMVLDIPRYSQVNVETVSTFAKTFATDTRDDDRVHVLGLASSAAAAAGFDAGGSGPCISRRGSRTRLSPHLLCVCVCVCVCVCACVRVCELSDNNAKELLKTCYGVEKPETATKIVQLVGTNPGRLAHAEPKEMAKAIEEGKNDEGVLAAISPKYRERVAREVRALLAIQIEGRNKQLCDVGREIAQALGKEDAVSHACWEGKDITLVSMAKQLKAKVAHAVYHHTEEERWHFVSRLHRDEARKQLKGTSGK